MEPLWFAAPLEPPELPELPDLLCKPDPTELLAPQAPQAATRTTAARTRLRSIGSTGTILLLPSA
jgi:hypothetical protein